MAHGRAVGGAAVNRRKHEVAARMKAHQQWRDDQVRQTIAMLERLPAMFLAVQRGWLKLIEELPTKLAEWQALADGLVTRHVERLQGGPDPHRRSAWWRL